MYVVTNRSIHEKGKGLDNFGYEPNELGPNELRLFKVEKAGQRWDIEVMSDKLEATEVERIASEFSLKIDTSQTYYASFRAAADIVRRARKQKRNVLFFVHGYNNMANSENKGPI